MWELTLVPCSPSWVVKHGRFDAASLLEWDGCGLKGNNHRFGLRESKALATAIHLLTGQIDSIVQDILDELFQTICDLMVGLITTQRCGGQIYNQVKKWISKIQGR